MQEEKRAQMKDVLQQMGYAEDEGRAVIKDHTSRAAGPNPYHASVMKMLCDSLNQKLKPIGLRLINASIGWEKDKSAEEVYAELQRIGLITKRSMQVEAA